MPAVGTMTGFSVETGKGYQQGSARRNANDGKRRRQEDTAALEADPGAISPQSRVFAPVRTSAAHNARSTAMDAKTSGSGANTERLLTESSVADKTHMEVLPNEQDEREAATTMLALSKHKIDDPPAASSSSAPPPCEASHSRSTCHSPSLSLCLSTCLSRSTSLNHSDSDIVTVGGGRK